MEELIEATAWAGELLTESAEYLFVLEEKNLRMEAEAKDAVARAFDEEADEEAEMEAAEARLREAQKIVTEVTVLERRRDTATELWEVCDGMPLPFVLANTETAIKRSKFIEEFAAYCENGMLGKFVVKSGFDCVHATPVPLFKMSLLIDRYYAVIVERKEKLGGLMEKYKNRCSDLIMTNVAAAMDTKDQIELMALQFDQVDSTLKTLSECSDNVFQLQQQFHVFWNALLTIAAEEEIEKEGEAFWDKFCCEDFENENEDLGWFNTLCAGREKLLYVTKSFTRCNHLEDKLGGAQAVIALFVAKELLDEVTAEIKHFKTMGYFEEKDEESDEDEEEEESDEEKEKEMVEDKRGESFEGDCMIIKNRFMAAVKKLKKMSVGFSKVQPFKAKPNCA